MGSEDDFEINEKDARSLIFIASNPSGAYPKRLAQYLGKNKSTGSRRLQRLMSKGLVSKKGDQSTHQFYEITKKGCKSLMRWLKTQPNVDKLRLRLHKISVKFPVNNGQRFIEENGSIEETVELRNNEQLIFSLPDPDFDEISWRVGYKHLQVKLGEIYAPPTSEGVWHAQKKALDISRGVKSRIEDKYEKLKFGRGEPHFAECHYAFESHPLGKVMERFGELGVISNDGKYRIVGDKSKGVPEIEVEGSEGKEAAIKIADNLEYQAEENLRRKINRIEERLDELES